MSIAEALNNLNNAVLDMQMADYNTFERPLKKMASVLQDSSLQAINERLKAGVDFDLFIEESGTNRKGIGGETLDWPTDREKELGLSIALIERAASDPAWFSDFAVNYYNDRNRIISSIRKATASVLVPFIRDYKEYVGREISMPTRGEMQTSDKSKVFIVHGHDDYPREAVARLLENQGIIPIILHEQANKGMSIVQKLKANSDVGFAIVLLTPDDLGRAKNDTQENQRARQNVILELGYFVGRLGMERVCAIRKDNVEIPSDYDGIVYIDFDAAGAWKGKLANELDEAGYEIDFKKILKGIIH